MQDVAGRMIREHLRPPGATSNQLHKVKLPHDLEDRIDL